MPHKMYKYTKLPTVKLAVCLKSEGGKEEIIVEKSWKYKLDTHSYRQNSN